jgi:hypothetical protein
MRVDQGTEYMTDAMRELMKKENIDRDETPAYSKDLHGLAERFNKELRSKTKCLIFSSGFPKCMWGYALQYVIDVYNKTPHKSIDNQIPYEMFCERPSTVKYFKRFGCLSYVLDPTASAKFQEGGIRGFLVGCDDMGYTVILPETGQRKWSKHVTFTESKVYGMFFNKNSEGTVLKDPIQNGVQNDVFLLTC